MMRSFKWLLVIATVALQTSLAPAQTAAPRDALAMMQTFVSGLGVKCDYCHVGGMGRMAGGAQQAQAQPGQPPSHMEVARNMMAMVKDLNERILPAATGKDASANTRIQCVTCHRGVAIPGQLSDIMAKAAFKDGGEAAVAQYRDLRKLYYGRQAYDFGEETLITAASAMATNKPDDAAALLKLNLEFYPQSIRTYTQLAYTYTRKLDDDAAIATLEKALEISPDNSMVKGQLEQLKSYHRK
jgi:tetratricopeptide (TPR) repeat protein